MAASDEDHFRWRETYFVWFDAARRPLLAKVEDTVRSLRGHFELSDAQADENGRIESLTVRSSEDHAALEIEYLEGDEVRSEAAAMAEEFKAGDGAEPARLARLRRATARFEIMHFEQVDESAAGGEGEEDDDEMFDPSALLIVLEALIKLTDGVGVDPQSGILM